MRRTLLAAALLVLVSRAAAVEIKEIKLDDVPFAAKLTASFAAESVTGWESATLVNGAEYRLVGKTAAGRRVEVRVDANGTIRDVLVSIEYSDATEAARTAFADKFPNFKVTGVATVGPSDRKYIGYRIEGTDADGRPRVAVVAADGSRVVVVESEVVTPVKPKADAGRTALEGKWKIVAGRKDGKEFAVKGGELIVDGNRFTLYVGAQTLVAGKLTLGAAGTPQAFDVTGPTFAESINPLELAFLYGRAWGIFTLKDGELRLCYSTGPNDLNTKRRDELADQFPDLWRPRAFIDAGPTSLIDPEFPDQVFDPESNAKPMEGCVYLRLERVKDGE